MMTDEGDETMGAQERAARALWLLIQEPMTTSDLADRLGMTPDGARRMLQRMSRIVPLYQDQPRDRWQILSEATD